MLIVVGTAAYLGLAVLGWGGFAAFFSHPALIALTVALFALSGAALFAGGNLSPGVREDRGNRWVIVPLGDRTAGRLSAGLHGPKEFWTIDGDTIRWLGVVLFAAGGALRIWPVFVLGRRFSGLVAIQPGHTLVTERCLWRHPPPQLSGVARQLAGVGPGLSFGGRRAAHGAPDRRSSRASARKSGCCARSLATSTTPTAPGRRG